MIAFNRNSNGNDQNAQYSSTVNVNITGVGNRVEDRTEDWHENGGWSGWRDRGGYRCFHIAETLLIESYCDGLAAGTDRHTVLIGKSEIHIVLIVSPL